MKEPNEALAPEAPPGTPEANLSGPAKPEKSPLLREVRSLAVRLAVFAAVLWVLLTQVYLVTQASGSEMFPAVKDGDLVLGCRLEKDYAKNDVVAQKNYLCHSLHIPPQAFIIRYTALFSNVDSGYFSRISTLFSITFQQNGVVMVYQTVLYQPDIFRSCRSDDPGKSTSFAICSAAWS